ncbi:hypothetical protein ACH495_31015 [Micromonospora sp. NPDC018662]|uniref:hypothetical protein n=1 Tax=Micromonospora sp. NPDC018662 TaxID=3364238 RepID=UPI00379325F9
MIEETGGPTSSDDLYRTAAMDAKMLQDRILTAAGRGIDVSDGRAPAQALAEALLAVVPDHLAQTSNEHDVELFLEVNGRPPADPATWPVTILAGLALRRIPAADRHAMCERAVQIAARRLRSSAGS